jgi:predicted ATP-grasp superfamily ATP-dependent carboligase
VPHPNTWHLKAVSDLEGLAPGDFSHAFLKPCQSQSFFRRYRVKAVTVKTRNEAIAVWKKLADDGQDMVLQDYIPGPASNHYFVDGMVDRQGDLKCTFARRRLRMYPPDYGNSCYQVSTAQGALLGSISALQGLLKATSYRGIFSAEFKLDERDGAYKLLEINCRPWWFIWFAQLCGLPMAEMAYVDALEEPLPTIRSFRMGLAAVDPYYDFASCMEHIKQGTISRGEWLDSWIFARHAHLHWRDPVPAVISHMEGLLRYLNRRIGPSTGSILISPHAQDGDSGL